ncbi:hypothetical protein OGAPHI_005007 [Ogataea philodendri]|uniref:mitogen-activated protein kinase kinase n=2 Tax=Ogataea TaxID=461281 RepID=A0A9P8T3A6_9ASCO|nr:uncharacterized protein OGAPHI_005007 [Ogataea philodendri]KAH3663606.1 hypothetical protein OGAPHI_005007 [Ogataea philodendri]
MSYSNVYKDLPPLPGQSDGSLESDGQSPPATSSRRPILTLPVRPVTSAQISSSSLDSVDSCTVQPQDRRPLPFLNIKPLSEPSRVVQQQDTASVVSSLNSQNQPPTPFLESKTLNRKNVKKLTLSAPQLTIRTNSTTSSLGNTSSMSPLDQAGFKDPDKKASTDELIANIQNLELGLEYQLPIKADELVLLKKLGSGNSGTVSKVLHLPTQKTMARKIIHIDAKEVIQSQIIRELRIMHECDSPFIIGFYGTFLHEGDVVICMEYVDCGSLDKIYKVTGPFPEFMLKHIAYSVLSGLVYLYDNHRIIHRDVKPSNVLLDSKGNIKLCDFGVSRELINSMADTFVGTSTYMSPERIQGGVYNVKGDVWSLGLMLFELASGIFAFGGAPEGCVQEVSGLQGDPQRKTPDSILDLLQRIVNETPPSLKESDGYSPELCQFVALCLKKEKDRPDPHTLLKHSFLSGFAEPDSVKVCPEYRSDIKKWAKNVRRVQKGRPKK